MPALAEVTGSGGGPERGDGEAKNALKDQVFALIYIRLLFKELQEFTVLKHLVLQLSSHIRLS